VTDGACQITIPHSCASDWPPNVRTLTKSCPIANVRTLTKSCPVAAVDVVQVIAVLCQELGVGGVEGQSVATGLEFRDSAVAFPVLVARMTVGVESIVIRALEVLLSQYCKKTQVCLVLVPGRLCCMSSNWGGGGVLYSAWDSPQEGGEASLKYAPFY